MNKVIRNWISAKLVSRREKKLTKLIRDKGLDALNAYYRVGLRVGTEFIPMFGTLLGAYRDHDFISFDTDIDMICNIHSLSNHMLDVLEQEGFMINKIFVSSDLRGAHLPMVYKGITCDIYFYYDEMSLRNMKHIYFPLPLNEKSWAYSFKLNIFRIKDICLHVDVGRMKCRFQSEEINIPINTDEILKLLYGGDYMLPKKNAHANPAMFETFNIVDNHFTCYPIDFFIENDLMNAIIERTSF